MQSLIEAFVGTGMSPEAAERAAHAIESYIDARCNYWELRRRETPEMAALRQEVEDLRQLVQQLQARLRRSG